MSIYDTDPETGDYRGYRAFGNLPGSLLPVAQARRYIAAWSEHGMPDGRNAGGAWAPMTWDQARGMLAGQFARNLSRWSSPETRAAYEQALAEMADAPEPASGGRAWHLARHDLSITPDSPTGER
jgi:hypothetical protein